MPGTSEAAPSVLVTDRSARGVSESVSVAVLLAPFGSLLPTGAATVAVFTSEPVAAGATVPVTVNVTVPATRRLTEALMLPLPEAGQVEPAVAVHVHVTPVSVAGSVSVTVAPVITDGPAFDATIVYVTLWPGMVEVTPSVLVIDRSPVGVKVSVSVAVLLAGVGSVTAAGAVMVAVFDKLPVAVVAIVAVEGERRRATGRERDGGIDVAAARGRTARARSRRARPGGSRESSRHGVGNRRPGRRRRTGVRGHDGVGHGRAWHLVPWRRRSW